MIALPANSSGRYLYTWGGALIPRGRRVSTDQRDGRFVGLMPGSNGVLAVAGGRCLGMCDFCIRGRHCRLHAPVVTGNRHAQERESSERESSTSLCALRVRAANAVDALAKQIERALILSVVQRHTPGSAVGKGFRKLYQCTSPRPYPKASARGCGCMAPKHEGNGLYGNMVTDGPNKCVKPYGLQCCKSREGAGGSVVLVPSTTALTVACMLLCGAS